MMQAATINVRLPYDLKQSGDKVLERAGVSTSVLIRDLYRYLEREQDVPAFVAQTDEDGQNARVQKRRKALSDIAGILDDEVDYDTLKWERLQRQIQPGTRL
jgi:antitoxin component of RelBE/YafQ-DinJ toxin-antitoxin module